MRCPNASTSGFAWLMPVDNVRHAGHGRTSVSKRVHSVKPCRAAREGASHSLRTVAGVTGCGCSRHRRVGGVGSWARKTAPGGVWSSLPRPSENPDSVWTIRRPRPFRSPPPPVSRCHRHCARLLLEFLALKNAYRTTPEPAGARRSI